MLTKKWIAWHATVTVFSVSRSCVDNLLAYVQKISFSSLGSSTHQDESWSPWVTMILKIFKINGLSHQSARSLTYRTSWSNNQFYLKKKKAYSLAGQKRIGTHNEAKSFVWVRNKSCSHTESSKHRAVILFVRAMHRRCPKSPYLWQLNFCSCTIKTRKDSFDFIFMTTIRPSLIRRRTSQKGEAVELS